MKVYGKTMDNMVERLRSCMASLATAGMHLNQERGGAAVDSLRVAAAQLKALRVAAGLQFGPGGGRHGQKYQRKKAPK